MTSLEKIVFVDFREGDIVSTEEKRLTLAYEGLTEVPQNMLLDYACVVNYVRIDAPYLALDLDNLETLKSFRNVSFLSQCKNLTTLIMDHNHIVSETVFPLVPTLTTLWINHNLIVSLHPFIQRLSESCPNLKCFSLMGNEGAPSYLTGGTYYEYLQYRLFVISWLPKLEYLDDRHVTNDQREEANRLYGRPFYHSLRYPHQYLQQFQRKFKQMIDSFSWSPPSQQEYRDGPFIGEGEAIRVQDMGTIQTESSSSSHGSSTAASTSRKRNLII